MDCNSYYISIHKTYDYINECEIYSDFITKYDWSVLLARQKACRLFVYIRQMIELSSCDPVNHDEPQEPLASFPRITEPLSYDEFFRGVLEKNRPCVFSSSFTQEWLAREEWVTPSNTPNVEFLRDHFGARRILFVDILHFLFCRLLFFSCLYLHIFGMYFYLLYILSYPLVKGSVLRWGSWCENIFKTRFCFTSYKITN